MISALNENLTELLQLFRGLSEEQLQHRYAADKWSIKEILLHLIDAERTFNYRIMRASRGDQAILPAWDIHSSVTNGHAAERNTQKMIEELELLRKATIVMFEDMPEAMLDLAAPARDTIVSVRAWGYAVVGHSIHHMEIIREKYLQTAMA